VEKPGENKIFSEITIDGLLTAYGIRDRDDISLGSKYREGLRQVDPSRSYSLKDKP
jgi:hypothetical protein